MSMSFSMAGSERAGNAGDPPGIRAQGVARARPGEPAFELVRAEELLAAGGSRASGNSRGGARPSFAPDHPVRSQPLLRGLPPAGSGDLRSGRRPAGSRSAHPPLDRGIRRRNPPPAGLVRRDGRLALRRRGQASRASFRQRLLLWRDLRPNRAGRPAYWRDPRRGLSLPVVVLQPLPRRKHLGHADRAAPDRLEEMASGERDRGRAGGRRAPARARSSRPARRCRPASGPSSPGPPRGRATGAPDRQRGEPDSLCRPRHVAAAHRGGGGYPASTTAGSKRCWVGCFPTSARIFSAAGGASGASAPAASSRATSSCRIPARGARRFQFAVDVHTWGNEHPRRRRDRCDVGPWRLFELWRTVKRHAGFYPDGKTDGPISGVGLFVGPGRRADPRCLLAGMDLRRHQHVPHPGGWARRARAASRSRARELFRADEQSLLAGLAAFETSPENRFRLPRLPLCQPFLRHRVHLVRDPGSQSLLHVLGDSRPGTVSILSASAAPT